MYSSRKKKHKKYHMSEVLQKAKQGMENIMLARNYL